MSKHTELLMTQTALTLIEDEGYKIIDVRIMGKEIWLNHPRNTRELLRLSLNGAFNLPMQEERTAAIRRAIEKIFGERTLLYDVRFDDEESRYELLEETAFVVLSHLTQENVFLDRFPMIRPILQKAEEKPTDLEDAQQRLAILRPKRIENVKPKMPKATFVVVVVCLAMYGIVGLFTDLGGYNPINTSILLGAYYKTFIIVNHEYWRFLTSGFIHTDLIHLVMNMYALYNLGLYFEPKFGWKQLILTLVVGVISGSAFLYITSGNLLAVGLSGGLFALLGAIVIYQIESGQIKYRPIQMQLLQLFVINLFIAFLPGIAVMAHVGGFFGGILVALYFNHKPSWKNLKMHVKIASGVLVIAMIGLIAIDKKHQPFYGKTDYEVVQQAYDFGLDWYADGLKSNLDAYYEGIN
ncbi:MAG: peptidase S54 (rhomboid) family [Erysipelotrichaceae bacterium]|nr:MAG: peptidase S54 (rhomboid) [Erysipelotrichaceae bacterium]TXT16662.1 MAG: peptidase S54 (rhomboid) family [Erysipelotrichaceae bacterium]